MWSRAASRVARPYSEPTCTTGVAAGSSEAEVARIRSGVRTTLNCGQNELVC